MTPKRAFWEVFATVCLPSLILWTIFAYSLRTKLNLPYAEALPIYLFLAMLPMPLAFPALPTNLRWLVDEADGCAHDDPLNEVGDGLVDGQRKADIQVDVVVDHEGADGEKADECAEVYA